MTTQAIIFMLVVWGLIIGCTGYCFKKLLFSDRRLDASDE
jgi:hypothetical protein